MFPWTTWRSARKAKELSLEREHLDECIRSITRHWKDPLEKRRDKPNAHRAERPRAMTSIPRPLDLGHYKGGDPARFGDVVRLNSGGPEMIVEGCTKGHPIELGCAWDTVLDRKQVSKFPAASLTLIRRAPEPAVAANPQIGAMHYHTHARLDEAATTSAPASRAPQVTPADVEAAIASEHYYTGMDGLLGWQSMRAQKGCFVDMDMPPALAGVMHCTLVARNGSRFTGESFCADLDNPDLDRARDAARRRAFDKLYDAVVYAARERLSTQ